MDDPLNSPRSRAEALRTMLSVAIRDATEAELVAVQSKIGAWAMEKLLDAALRPTAIEEPQAAPSAASTPIKTKAPRGGPKRADPTARCEDAERIQLALLGLKERYELHGVPWTKTEIGRLLGHADRIPDDILDCSTRRMGWGRLRKIEAFLNDSKS